MDRGPRRRESDEDSYTPSFSGFEARDSGQRSSQALSGPPITGTVKWYSPEKGFGFVGLSDGSGDAFLHGSVLERTGNLSVLPGSTLELRVVPGPKGPQVKEVISVEAARRSKSRDARGQNGPSTAGRTRLPPRIWARSSSTLPRRGSASSASTTVAKTLLSMPLC